MKPAHYSSQDREARLRQRFGTATPFTVPDDYFTTLSGRVMNHIASRHRRRRIWQWTAAAIFVGCMAAGGLLLGINADNLSADAANAQYIEDALDYTMLDNASIAYYLTEAE